jgi:uncharacterized membrane protein
LEPEYAMTSMFTIPGNTLLVIGVAIVLAIIGFVIYGCIKGWENVMKDDYEKHRDELNIET